MRRFMQPPLDTKRIPTDTLAAPVHGSNFTHKADCKIEYSIATLPGVGDDLIMAFRLQDATNLWYIDHNNDGSMSMGVYVAGAPAQQDTAAAGSVSAGDEIIIQCYDEEITVFVQGLKTMYYGSASNFKTETDGTFSIADGTVGPLASYPI